MPRMGVLKTQLLQINMAIVVRMHQETITTDIVHMTMFVLYVVVRVQTASVPRMN